MIAKLERTISYREKLSSIIAISVEAMRMSHPVAVTINLFPFLKDQNSRFSKRLDEYDIEWVVQAIRNNVRKIYWRKKERIENKSKRILLGSYQEGKESGQPHLHLIIDNCFKKTRDEFRNMMNICCSRSNSHYRWINKDPVIDFDCDNNWIKYFMRDDLFYPVF